MMMTKLAIDSLSH